MRSAVSEQIPIPVLGHPFGACEVALEDAPRALGFMGGINMQHNSRHFGPVCTFGVGIEQAQIGDQMFLVIILALRMCLTVGGLTARRDSGLLFSC